MKYNCSYFDEKKCHSCDLMNLGYIESLSYKETLLTHLFFEHKINPIIQSEPVFHSRNKAKLVVSGSLDNPIIGILNHEDQYVDLLNCPLHIDEINQLIHHLKIFIKDHKLIPYNFKNQKGELKYLIIFKSDNSLMLRFVLRSKESLDRIKKGVKELQNKFNSLKVVSINIQPENKAIIEGEEEIILTSETFMEVKLAQYNLIIKPKSFFQTNTNVALKLYEFVQSKIQQIKPNHCLDLYCGIGAFSFFISPFVKEITAIEISSEAIDSGVKAKTLNQINNIDFICGDVENGINNWTQNKKVDVVIVNPPRRGLTLGVIKSLLKLRAPYIIYSSCNYESFYENYLNLKTIYTLQEIQPFDMFPLTKHLEMVGIFKLT